MMQIKLDLQDLLLAREEQEELLRRRERELTALKGALKEEVATHDQEVDKLREQYEKELRKLQTAVEDAKQVMTLPLHILDRNNPPKQCYCMINGKMSYLAFYVFSKENVFRLVISFHRNYFS